MIKRKKISIILGIIIMNCICILPVSASEKVLASPGIEINNIIEPRVDVIVTKYRVYKGVKQYRRWNETKGEWVDPYWIDIR